MRGSLRVHRLVIVPGATFVTGVFTGELREDDGSLVGVDSRRATLAADLVRQRRGYLPSCGPSSWTSWVSPSTSPRPRSLPRGCRS